MEFQKLSCLPALPLELSGCSFCSASKSWNSLSCKICLVGVTTGWCRILRAVDGFGATILFWLFRWLMSQPSFGWYVQSNCWLLMCRGRKQHRRKRWGHKHKYDLYRRRSTFTFGQNVRVFRDRQNKQIANGRFGAREHNYCHDLFSSTHRK